jgi:prolyl-tRNA synthetase
VTGDRLVLALVRGDDKLSPEKLETLFEAAFRPATDEEIRAAFGAGGGSLGPVGVDLDVIADEALREGQYVAGANEDGKHLRGVQAGRDYQPTFADIRQAKDGDFCPDCGGTLRIETAIEVGHIFKLGTFHSRPEAFGATFLDEDGREKPLVMGSYGIGLARTMAAIVEQSHDENGIVWPQTVAPYDVHVVALPGADEIAFQAAEALSTAGLEVLLDDRDQRAGEKFADADLIGCPIRITAGRKSLEDGKVDVRNRASGDEKRLDVAELGKEVQRG